MKPSFLFLMPTTQTAKIWLPFPPSLFKTEIVNPSTEITPISPPSSGFPPPSKGCSRIVFSPPQFYLRTRMPVFLSRDYKKYPRLRMESPPHPSPSKTSFSQQRRKTTEEPHSDILSFLFLPTPTFPFSTSNDPKAFKTPSFVHTTFLNVCPPPRKRSFCTRALLRPLEKASQSLPSFLANRDPVPQNLVT